MSDEEKETQQKVQDEQAADSTKRIISTVAKGVGSAYGGPEVGAAIGAAEKIPEVDHAEREISKKVNEAASTIDPNLKEKLADNNQKIATATNLADNLIGGNPTDFSKGTPENINLDNHGYNPSLQMSDSHNEPSNITINPDTINQDVTPQDKPNDELESLRQKHSKKNNINDTAKGEIKLPPEVLVLLPVVGIIFFILIFLLVMFYNQINDEEHITYEYTTLNTCSRIIFNEDLELLKDELEEINQKIQEAIRNNDIETQNTLIEEKYDLIPSLPLDDYVAWLVEKEVGEFENEALYYDFAIAIRTYLFNNSSIEDNFCYIDETQTDGINGNITKAIDYTSANNEDIIKIVKDTHNYVLVVNNQYIDTNFNALCEDHTDDEFYYLTERNQALDKQWVDDNVNDKNTEDQCINNNGISMSKYGALYLNTVKDYGWKDILAYYYDGNIEIKLVNIIEMDKKGTPLYPPGGEGSADLPTGDSGFAWPVTGMDAPNTCSRGIGVDGHYGMDIRRAQGTPVYASASGTVVGVGIVGTNGLDWSYGNGVKIKTDNNYMTIYAHFDQPPFVSMGQRVAQGQQIGVVGTTGNSTGYHLHFEVQTLSGARVDPFTLLSGLPACCGRGRTCPR